MRRIEIGVIIIKKHVFLNFVKKYVRLNRKKVVIIAIIIEYVRICLNLLI